MATSDLVRVGAVMDGGYVLPARVIPAADGLLSFGLSDEWEFEAEFHAARGKRVVCFDHSVDAAFWVRKAVANTARAIGRLKPAYLSRAMRFRAYRKFFDGVTRVHVRKPVGYPSATSVDLAEALRIGGFDSRILLKMDIEGWEYRVLEDIVAQRERFIGMAIEFHDVDLHADRIVSFIERIADSFALVHFHANSHTVIGPGGQSIVVEMSFMNRALLRPGEELQYRSLPVPGLDSPNLPGDREAPVSFE